MNTHECLAVEESPRRAWAAKSGALVRSFQAMMLASALVACTSRPPPPDQGGAVDPERGAHSPDTASAAAYAALSKPGDSFAWLEERSERTQIWESAANQRTASYFDTVPGFSQIVDRVKRYEDVAPPPKLVDVRGETIFSLEMPGGGHRARLERTSPGKPSSTLFELSDNDAVEHVNLDWFALSPRGRYVALGTSSGGREMTTVRILDAATGKDLGDRSLDVRLGQLAWYADDSGYLYERGRGEAVPVVDRTKDLSVAEHILGHTSDQDIEVAGSRAKGPRLGRDYDYLSPQTSYDGKYDLIESHHGTAVGSSIFVAERGVARGAEPHWIAVYDDSNPVHNVFAAHDHFLALCQRGAKDVIEEAPFARPDSRRVLYASSAPLDSVFEIGGSVFAVAVGPRGRQILRIRDDARIDAVTDTSVSVSSGYQIDWPGRRAVFQFQSLSQPDSWNTIGAAGDVKPVHTSQAPVFDEPFETWEADAPARDGESIHLVLTGPRGNRAPTYIWMRVYGSYGIARGPAFAAATRAFLDLGGTYVEAQVRGGGGRGEAWHEAGRGPRKIKTVEDTVDVVRFMRARGFGAGGGIFVSGASAGGIPVGGLLTREPGLIDGAAILSGVVNMTRFMAASPTAQVNRPEFGDPDTEEGARFLRDLDAFEGVHNGVLYPPVLLVTALNDVRVPYWQSTKLAARLQQDSSSHAPALVHITDGGHLGGGDGEPQFLLDAQLLAFALSSVHNPNR